MNCCYCPYSQFIVLLDKSLFCHFILMHSNQILQESSPEVYACSPSNSPKDIKRRKRFTEMEDMLLKHLVQIYGQNWDAVAAHMEGRNKRQVKERWNSFLSPNLIAVPFTPDEDRLLEEKINEIGTKWVILMKYFPNRTDVSLKNRWNMIKRQRANGGKHQNRKKITPQSSGPAPVLYQTTPVAPVQAFDIPKETAEIEEFSFFDDNFDSFSTESILPWI